MFTVNLKLSLYRPGQALRAAEGLDFQISRQSAYEGGNVISPRSAALPPEDISGTHFC
jgi:hypothetical protein